jgi:hypothetical protein
LEKYRDTYAGTKENQTRLDRAQKRLDRRYPEGPNRPTAKEQDIQAKVSGDQPSPRNPQPERFQRQEDMISPTEEWKCPTSGEEEK